MPEARSRADLLLERYRTRGVLLDANLLVLYVIGRHDRRLIRSAKVTRQFEERDFEVVSGIVGYLGGLFTTPHLLTEANSLANTGVPTRHRWDFLRTFRTCILEATEVRAEAAALVDHSVFQRLGLADAALADLATQGPLPVSTDLDRCVALESRGVDVINYNHIRPLS